jgi:Flp pilus assembly protein TadG
MRIMRQHPRRGRTTSPERGQSLVEFSLVLIPLLMILLGIIQFGFVFNAYITISNATREGAREGTIYLYQSGSSKAQNDLARNTAIKDAVIGSMNLLGTTAPRFTTSGNWTQSGTTFSNGDLVVTYAIPHDVSDSDSRVGQRLTVRATYHQDIVVPMVGDLLPKDTGGRLRLTSEVTMVIN